MRERKHKELAVGLMGIGAAGLIAAALVYDTIANEKYPRWWIPIVLTASGAGFGVLGICVYFGLPKPVRWVLVRIPNRYRLITWIDQRRGRYAALGHRQHLYLGAMQLERQDYQRRGERRRVRDVDQQIQDFRRTGAPWVDEQAGATPIDQTAPLDVVIEQAEWSLHRRLARILEMRVRVHNNTDTRKTLTGIEMQMQGAAQGFVNPDVSQEVFARRRRLGELANQSIIEPRDSVVGWIVHAFDFEGATPGEPEYTLAVVDEHNVRYEAHR